MNAEHIFSIVNTTALLSWVLLVVLPGRKWISTIVTGTVVPALLSMAYVVLIAMAWRGSAGGFSTLAEVATLFQNRWLLLAGWIHYLAFDLLIGSWEARDAREKGISHLLVVPCLALTFMFGPAGWLLYMTLRTTVGGAKRI